MEGYQQQQNVEEIQKTVQNFESSPGKEFYRMECLKSGRGQGRALVRVVRSVFRKEPVVQKLINKLHEELNAEENGKVRMNNGLRVDCREGPRSTWDFNELSSGGYAIVRELEESVARNAKSQGRQSRKN